MIRKILTTVLVCFLVCCKKDPPVPSSECVDLPDEPMMGWNVIETENNQMPCINPENPDEIIFMQIKNSISQLIKYNITSQEKQLVYNGRLCSQPKWGKSNWILLCIDMNIYKIKSTGDSLTQLTFSGGNFLSFWNNNYDRIGYSGNNGTNRVIYIIDVNGQKVDSITNPEIGSVICWNHNEYIATIGYSGIVLYDTQKKSIVSLAPLPPKTGSGFGIIFTNSNTVVYSFPAGINQTTISEKQTSQLLSYCYSRLYLYPSFCPSANKILWQKVIETADGDNLYVQYTIVIMNADGTDEKKIVIES